MSATLARAMSAVKGRRPVRASPLTWVLGTMYVGICLYLVSPDRDRFPGVFVTIVAFGLLPTLITGARPDPRTVFCPLNWTLVAFSLQLVVVPLLVCFGGPVRSVLPFLPSDRAINVSLLLSAVAFAGFCAGYALSSRRTKAQRAQRPASRWEASGDLLIAVYAGLGIAGVFLAYHSFGSLLNYFEKAGHPGAPVTPDLANSSSSSLGLVASLFLRPFLGFAIVLLWCRWMEHRRRRPQIEAVMVTIAAAAGVILTYSTFSYNRGAFVAPIIALLAVYGRKVRQLSVGTVVVLGAVAVISLTAYRYYRTTDISLGQAVGNQSSTIVKGVHVDNELQEYAGAPQFTGYLLQQTDYGRHLQYGKTLVGSLLSPVPKLGRLFRSSSGTVYYNRLVYGDAGTNDQVTPLEGELFINFWWPGVALGYLLIGIAVRRLQERFDAAPTAIQAFVWQYTGVWIAFLAVGGLAPVSQIFIYFFWPAYALPVLSRLRARRAATVSYPSPGSVSARRSATTGGGV